MSEVIYEKHYPHKTVEERMREADEIRAQIAEDEANGKADPMPSFEEFYKDMMENRELVPIPNREELAGSFVLLAIVIGEEYELDTTIRKSDSHVTVDFSFDCGGDMDFFLPLLRAADNITFFTGIRGYEITMTIEYYTHAVYRHGKRLYPRDLR